MLLVVDPVHLLVVASLLILSVCVDPCLLFFVDPVRGKSRKPIANHGRGNPRNWGCQSLWSASLQLVVNEGFPSKPLHEPGLKAQSHQSKPPTRGVSDKGLIPRKPPSKNTTSAVQPAAPPRCPCARSRSRRPRSPAGAPCARSGRPGGR